MATLTEVIRSLSLKYERVENLMRCITVKSLKHAHEEQPANKATGIDKTTKAVYEEQLEENLESLVVNGLTVAVMGTALFRNENMEEYVRRLHQIGKGA